MTDKEEREWIEATWLELMRADPEPITTQSLTGNSSRQSTLKALCQVLDQRREMRYKCLKWVLKNRPEWPAERQVSAALQYYEFIRS